MEKDLKWIKKHYGEQMMHLCRENLQQILEVEGVLPKLLEEHFPANRTLAQDIESQSLVNGFKNYIFSLVDVEKKEVEVKVNKTAKELFDEAGYILYPECKTEEDIQAFRKYSAPGEELCTFRGGRLNSCRVWFAVKKDVDKIRRENFKNPSRQDEYGTSVISIQFTRGNSPTLSIKNRYNHAVNNPDNTFNSNLNNIKDGLEDAFYRDYGVRTAVRNSKFELDGYVSVGGKYYKYNYETHGVYYCPNNIVIQNFIVKKLPPHQVLADCMIFDMREKKIISKRDEDGEFCKTVRDLKDVLFKDNEITLTRQDGSEVKIGIDGSRRIVSLTDDSLTNCGGYYMMDWQYVERVSLPKLESCGNGSFRGGGDALETLELPSLTKCGYSCFNYFGVRNLSLPNLIKCEENCFNDNPALQTLNLPKLEKGSDKCFVSNPMLRTLELPNLKEVGESWFYNNSYLETLNVPNLERCGRGCFSYNMALQTLFLPNLKVCYNDCFVGNDVLQTLTLPSLKECDDYCFYDNDAMQTLALPRLTESGEYCFSYNTALQTLFLPNLKVCYNFCFSYNTALQTLFLPNLKVCFSYCFVGNDVLQTLNLPSLVKYGEKCFEDNPELKVLQLPQPASPKIQIEEETSVKK